MSEKLDESIYNEEFHKDRGLITGYTARKVLGLLVKAIPELSSAVDVGCGTGTWVKTFSEVKKPQEGVRILGIDGGYLPLEQLEIKGEDFHAQNLEDRIDVDERFDIAISLEVAEHLSPERADSFAEDLTKLSDIVLFSAAVPGQGGEGHINEQFLSYWKDKFEKLGYEIVDCIRPNIMGDGNIPWWYQQNMVIYVKRGTEYYDRLMGIEKPAETDLISVNLYISKLEIIGRLAESNNELAANNEELRRLLGVASAKMQEMAGAITELTQKQ